MTLEELGERVKAIRADWEAKAAAGDLIAARMLRECFGDRPVEQKVDVAADKVTKHWSEREEDGHGD